MGTCLICLGAEPADTDEGRYHVACLRSLFRTETAPRIKFDLAHFPTRIVPELGKMSLARISTLEAEAVLDEVLGRLDDALALIERSLLPEALRKSYARVLKKRARSLV